VEQIRDLKIKRQGHWERKREYRFLLIFSSKVDRFTSNQDQTDQRPILHISSNAFHQWKCVVFAMFVPNYPVEPHVAAGTWPCTYLFNKIYSVSQKKIPLRLP